MSETSPSRPETVGDRSPAAGRRPLPPAAPPARIAAAILVALVVAAVVDALLFLASGWILGRPSDPSFAVLLTVLGVLVGVVGWVIVRRFVPRPAAVLRVLVPLVVLLSFIPDLYLVGTLPAVRIAALMIMHVVVAVATVTALRRVLPV